MELAFVVSKKQLGQSCPPELLNFVPSERAFASASLMRVLKWSYAT